MTVRSKTSWHFCKLSRIRASLTIRHFPTPILRQFRKLHKGESDRVNHSSPIRGATPRVGAVFSLIMIAALILAPLAAAIARPTLPACCGHDGEHQCAVRRSPREHLPYTHVPTLVANPRPCPFLSHSMVLPPAAALPTSGLLPSAAPIQALRTLATQSVLFSGPNDCEPPRGPPPASPDPQLR